MSRIPVCEHCGEGKIRLGRYEDWICRCCNGSGPCPHRVPRWKRALRRLRRRRA